MPQGFTRAARLAVLAQFCAIAFALPQVSDGPIAIIPRPLPTGATGPAARPVMRVDSSLVLIPVHVTTESGSSVTGLKKDDFVLFEDGVQQTITHFAQDDAPVSAGVLLDISGSMKNKMAKAAEAASAFFKFANPEDEFFLVEFNSRARLAAPFTHDWEGIAAQIAGAKPSGMTAMLDGIQLAIAQMKHARNQRKALLIVSDGGDNFSRRSMRQLKDTLVEGGVQVYALGVFDNNLAVKHTPEERKGPGLLDEVAVQSGGRTFPVVTLDRLPDIGVEIARDLRNQYVLGYSPAAQVADGKFHRVNLKLAMPEADNKLRTYYRQGYYAPEQ
jgi:Ca-activated chloride channel homolog